MAQIDFKTAVKEYIDYAGSGTDIDAFITDQTKAAYQYFSAMIGQNIEIETNEQIFAYLECRNVYLSYSLDPTLNSITTYPRFSSTGTAVSSDDYEEILVHGRPCIILRDLLLNTKYVFNITSGFAHDDADFPETIKTVMIEYIVLKLFESDWLGHGKSRLAISTTITDMTDGLKSVETIKDMASNWYLRLLEYVILDSQ